MATRELAEKLDKLFEERQLSIDDFAHFSYIFGTISKLYQMDDVALVISKAFNCFTYLVTCLETKDVKNLDDRVLERALFGLACMANCDTLHVNTLVYVKLLVSVKLLKSEILNKQLTGVKFIEGVMNEKNANIGLICDELVKLEFLDVILKQEVHRSLVRSLLSIVTYLVQYEKVTADHINMLWRVAVHQHSSVCSIYINEIKLMTYCMSITMTNALFGAIISENVFNTAVLYSLREEWPCFDEIQNAQLFDALVSKYISSEDMDEFTSQEFVKTVCALVPKDSGKQNELTKMCVQLITEDRKCDFALAVLQKTIEQVSQDDIEALLDVAIDLAASHRFEMKYLSLLVYVLRRLIGPLKPYQFDKLYELTTPLFASDTDRIAVFYRDLFKTNPRLFTLDASFKLFKYVCDRVGDNKYLTALLKMIVRAMNPSGDMKSGIAIQQLWEILFRTGNVGIADFLLSIYNESQTENSMDEYLARCHSGIPSLGSFVGINMFISQAPVNSAMKANRFISDSDMITIRLMGYVTENVSVLNDCCLDDLITQISRITGHMRTRIRCVDVNGRDIFRSTFVPVNGMIVTVIVANGTNLKSQVDLSLIKNEYQEEWLNVLKSGDETVVPLVFRVLNRLHTCWSVVKMIKDGKWDEVFDAQYRYLLLYHMHAVGVYLRNKDHAWMNMFYTSGGATRFISALLDNIDLFEKDVIPVLNIATEIVTNVLWQNASEYASEKLIDFILRQGDGVIVSRCTQLLMKLGSIDTSNDSVAELCGKCIFSPDAEVRKEIYGLMSAMTADMKQKVVMNLLDASMNEENTGYEYAMLLGEIIETTTNSKLLWDALVGCMFNHYKMPDTEDITEQFMFKAPSSRSHKSLFSALNLLIKRLDVVENNSGIFWFIVDEVLFNTVKCYEITEDIYEILVFLAKLDPSVLDRLLPMIANSGESFAHQSDNIRMTTNQEHKGIANLGCTCYMNATIQQLFAVSEFRNAVLESAVSEDWFSEFQYAFGKLVRFPSSYVSISNFACKWTGWDSQPVDVHQQQDAGEFLQLMLERMEKILPDTVRLFKGKIRHVLTTPADETVSNDTYEDFITLPLEVKGMTSISDSFRMFLTPDHFDSYSLEGIGKVEAFRNHRVSEAPQILIVQLKRFMFNLETCIREKINDRFVFPSELDLAPIKVNQQEPDMYDLCGIVMHSGAAQAGHYFSHVKTNDGWFTFNDTVVTPCDIKTMLESGYGGGTIAVDGWSSFENTKSAYLLFYQKRSALASAAPPGLSTSLMERLVTEVKHTIMRRLITSDLYGKFVAQMCADSPWILFQYVCHMMSANCANVESLVNALCTSLAAHNDISDRILADITTTDNFLLKSSNKIIRTQYLRVIEKSIALAGSDAIAVMVNNICEHTRSGFVMQFWRNFDEFFQPIVIALKKGFDKSLVDKDAFATLLYSTVKSYAEQSPSKENFYKAINLSAIMNILMELDTAPSAELESPEFIDNMRENPAHCAVFVNFMFTLCTPENLSGILKRIAEENTNISSMVFCFGLLLKLQHSSAEKLFKTFTKLLMKRNPNALQYFWESAAAVITDPVPGNSLVFIRHSKHLLSPFLLYESHSVRSSFAKFVMKLVASDSTLGKKDLISLYKNLVDMITRLASFLSDRNIDGYYTQDPAYLSMHDASLSYFELMTAIVNHGQLTGEVIGCARVFTSIMSRFGEFGSWESPRKHLFEFILTVVGSQYCELFFTYGKFSEFMEGFDNFKFDKTGDGVMTMKHLFAFVPSNGADTFFKSKMFEKLVYIIFGEQYDAIYGKELMEFILSKLTSSNVKRVCDMIWTRYRFGQCRSNYMKLAWRILKAFPEMSSIIFSEEIHYVLLSRILDLTKPQCQNILAVKLCAKVLALFNEKYAELNADKRTIFGKNIVEKLANDYLSYVDIVDFLRLTPLYIEGAPKGSICRLIVSFARMSREMCNALFWKLSSNEAALFQCGSPMRHYMPRMVAQICKYQMQFASADLTIVAQSIALMTNELCAVTQAMEPVLPITVDCLCDELSQLSTVFGDAESRINVSMDLMFQQECQSEIFAGGVFALAKAASSPESAPNWIYSAQRTLGKAIRLGLADDKELENVAKQINECFAFIMYFVDTYNLQVPQIASNDDQMTLAGKLEGQCQEVTSLAAEALTRLFTQVECTQSL